MPFTLSHAVVALPFRHTRLPAVGVAAGAMVPDLPLYAPIGVRYSTTHELWAAPSVDVLLGLLLLVLWGVVLRPALLAVLPGALRGRLPRDAARPRVPRPTPGLLVALAVGALTHVTWDAFTHPGRWGTRLVPALQDPVGGLPLASWCQYASGLLGLALLAGWGWRRLAGQERQDVPAALDPVARRVLGAVVLAAAGLGASVGVGAATGQRADALAFAAAVGAIDAGAAVLIMLGTALALLPTST